MKNKRRHHKAVFIDKDGTLIPDIPYNVNPDLITLSERAITGISLLRKQGFLLVVVSNQSGIAKGYFSEKELKQVWNKISSLLAEHQLSIDAYYYCPHAPDAAIEQYAVACDCRKPMPGMILKAANDLDIDTARSWMIGDILHDIEAGNRAGCKTILINNGNETEWKMTAMRKPTGVANDLEEAAHIILKHEQPTPKSSAWQLNSFFYGPMERL
jgi:D,D-heptose 1,7-bisphosphate phosphatase